MELPFEVKSSLLFITLPSGRRLSHVKLQNAGETNSGGESVTYEGIKQVRNGIAELWSKICREYCPAISRGFLLKYMLCDC